MPMLFDAEGDLVIQFEPVPQARRRQVGWDAERQRAFIALLDPRRRPGPRSA